MDRTQQVLGTIDAVSEVHFACPGTLLASDRLCTDVVMKDGARSFDHVGFKSFGSTAVNVFVVKAGGLVSRIASCDGVSTPNLHRSSALGHHFHPTLIDLKEAVVRYREVLEEVEWWPQCPQYWEVQDQRGVNYRYCARPRKHDQSRRARCSVRRRGCSDPPPLMVRQHEMQRERRQDEQRRRSHRAWLPALRIRGRIDVPRTTSTACP